MIYLSIIMLIVAQFLFTKSFNKYNPLTFTKNAPSFFDLFFCEQPQNYISDDLLTDNPNVIEHEKELKMIEIEDEEKFKYFNKR